MRTRIQLQNTIGELYPEVYQHNTYWGNKEIQDFFRYVLGTIYSEPVDPLKLYSDEKIFMIINNTIENDDFDDVLTLIEAIVQYWDDYLKKSRGYNYYTEYNGYGGNSLYGIINKVFKREYIGYRFIGEKITPISDDNEIEAISESILNKYAPVREHVLKANTLLADREKPDYENSIKESISAVEALCEILTGVKGKEATLGKMLKKLEDMGIEIHSGLKSAFNILFGYTSDANGIRHAGDIGGPSSTFEEARFMLVSCSAFINYLTALCAD